MAEESIHEVVALGLKLLTPVARRCRARLAELLDPEFTEIGASGRLRTRAEMIAALIEDEDSVRRLVPVAEVTGRLVGPGLVLVTYVSDPDGRADRRSSLWRRSDGTWRVRHHQGAPLSPAG